MPMEDFTGQTSAAKGFPVIRIVLVEDHVILRDGLRSLLEMDAEFKIVGEAGGFAEGMEVVASRKPDLVITDIRLAGDSGLKLIPALKKAHPSLRAMILTAHCTDEYVRAALEAGADGYVLKEASREELAQGIRTVMSGKQYFSTEVTTRVVSGFLGNEEKQKLESASKITPREAEVLTLIAHAYSTKAIARKLDLSVKTVEKHRSNLMAKLELRSSAAITLYAVRHNYISAEAPDASERHESEEQE
ncbi:MAG: response regulator transcription factor [Gammaproteobacteria bacterium]|nr:response regulator transcription factor [Gammaproteobacteria bacterium]